VAAVDRKADVVIAFNFDARIDFFPLRIFVMLNGEASLSPAEFANAQ
jgi:hypothetical protein